MTQLQKKFSNLKMVDTVSAIKIDEKALKDEGIDLIISTVEMKTSIRSVVVSPLLNLEDVAKIRHVLRKLAKDKVFKRDIRAFKEKCPTLIFQDGAEKIRIIRKGSLKKMK